MYSTNDSPARSLSPLEFGSAVAIAAQEQNVSEMRLGPSLETEEQLTSGPRVVEAPLRSQQDPVSSGSSSSLVGTEGIKAGNFIRASEDGISNTVLESIKGNKKLQTSDVSFSKWIQYITLGTIDLNVECIVPGSKIRSVDKLYVERLCADILNSRIGWTPQAGATMYVMEQTTTQATGDDHDDQTNTYLCMEGMHRVIALKMAGYDRPVRFTLVRQLSIDDMIFTGARMNQQGDKRYVGNLISEFETHRRALECIVEKELQKRQDSDPKVWLEIANKVKPS